MGKRRARNKGPRRSYLKRFSSAMTNVGPTPNSNMLRELSSHVAGIGKPIVEARKVYIAEAANKDTWNRIVTIDGPKRRVALYFQGLSWVWVEWDKKLELLRRSIIYGTKARALEAWDNNRVTWAYEMEIKDETVNSERP